MTFLRNCSLAAVFALASSLAHAGKGCNEIADGDDLVAPPIKAAKLDARGAGAQRAREGQRPLAMTPTAQRAALAAKSVQIKKP